MNTIKNIPNIESKKISLQILKLIFNPTTIVLMTPFLCYLYVLEQTNQTISKQMFEYKNTIAQIISPLPAEENTEEVIDYYYEQSCENSKDSLVCEMDITDSSYEANGHKVYADLEAIRNNTAFRVLAKDFLENHTYTDHITLTYPFVGSHMAFLDTINILSKADKVKKITVHLKEDLYEYKGAEQISEYLQRISDRTNEIKDLEIYKLEDSVILEQEILATFKLNDSQVTLTYGSVFRNKVNSKENICLMHDEGPSWKTTSFEQVICDVYYTAANRMEDDFVKRAIQHKVWKAEEIWNANISVQKVSQDTFDHNHQTTKPERKSFEFEDSHSLVKIIVK